MELREKIKQDIKEALQNKEELRLLVLRGVNSAIQNKEIEKKTRLSKQEQASEELEEKSKLTDKEIIDVIFSEVKKRKDAIEGFKKGGRDKMIKKEQQELEILKQYLPEQMSQEQIKEEAKKVINEVNAASLQDVGKVMGALISKVKGKADGKLVNKIVVDLLKEQ